MQRIIGAVVATAVSFASSACVLTAQRTSFVAVSDEIDSNEVGPATDLSSASDYYELAGGLSVSRFEFFTGWGLGAQRAHVRTRTSATEPDDIGIAERAHVGASFHVVDLGAVRLRVFGIFAGALVDLMFDNSDLEDDEAIDSRTSRSYEVGLEASLSMPIDSEYRPALFFRLGYADQAGKVSGREFGMPEYDATAIVFTLGGRVSVPWPEDGW